MKFIDFFKITTADLRQKLDGQATRHGEDSWLFLPEGDLTGRICLVAHIDTVFDRAISKKKIIIYDKEKGLITSPQGLGADDRAGVYALFKLWHDTKNQTYQPILLLTDGEETGGRGAQEAASLYPELSMCNYFIELDRKGARDAVFYNWEPEKFEKYILDFGFKAAFGTFTDVSIICPSVQICGVNLSIGYYNAHTLSEYLDVNAMQRTVSVVKKMLIDNCSQEQWILESFYQSDNLDYDVFCPDCMDFLTEDKYCRSCRNIKYTDGEVREWTGY